ncbi:hypothetical protein Rhopal_002348-T1 [Rhodotorula paludigena]|uniref:RNA-binding protein VTS1 n=1 Tax=Rhodotorula paludigena TaxID=86838 RepID=A0AAV5GGN4_9BASI|nr:hypothetical protein Rhopal_002348-T1 [Rhodotorula paludigena]
MHATRDGHPASPRSPPPPPATTSTSTLPSHRASFAPAHPPQGLSSSGPTRFSTSDAPAPAKLRASVAHSPAAAPSSASANWRAVSPGRASTGAVGLGASSSSSLRPASELLGVSHGAHHAPQQQHHHQGADTEAIDRWFEDLQQYEATLEEMAAASLDTNFKEELTAIEQWFRVLSEAERTAALYSLLQSATPLQMRFFITVLQQMARQDPVSAALLSPANPSQLSFESQMEAKIASLGLKSPASPVVRQFARQSLAASSNANAHSTSAGSAAPDSLLSLDLGASASNPAASTLASQRAKLKASARTSAPANLLLSASATSAAGLGEGLKSPLWGKDETVRERSPSPRPKSTGSSGDAPSSSAYLRSPALDGNGNGGGAPFEAQLSPLVGGSWASMVNTPLIPMFGKGDTMEPGNYGGAGAGGIASPNLESVGQRLSGWNGGAGSPNPNHFGSGEGGIVLDDARKFRRSARVGGPGGISGGALGGMYDGGAGAGAGDSASTAQKRVQDQLAAVQQLKNLQQSALSLGLGSALGNPPPASPGAAAGVGGSRMTSTGALSSPGLQQTAMAAQQNWRNANAAHLPPQSPQQGHDAYGGNHHHHGQQHQQQHLNGLGVGHAGGASPGLAGLGMNAPGTPSAQQIQAQTQAQIASLLALQQQMMQQQQQLQNLASLNGLGVGLGGGAANAGLGVGMLGAGGLLGPQLSPRLGGGGGGASPSFGLGFGGMPSPRRSPRPHGNDRSPHLSSYGHSSRSGGAPGGGGGGGAGANPQQTPGSGANPDEPLDMALLGDTPAWLRSLRLHKYTPNFEGHKWQEMVLLGDKDLEDKGVSALGARRKLLKVFETVRTKTGMAHPDGAVPTSPIGASPTSPTGSHSPVVENLVNGDAAQGDKPASPVDATAA